MHRVYRVSAPLLSTLLALALLAACGASTPAVTSAPLPAGWATVRQAGISLALPPGWEVVGAEEGDFGATLDDFVRENPRLAAVAAQARESLASGQIVLFAVDLAPEDLLETFTTNLSVGRQAMEQRASLDDVAQANEQALIEAGMQDVRRGQARITGEDVARLSSTIQIRDVAGEPLDLAYEQAVLLRDRQQYVLTFTTTATERERLLPVFEQIIATVRVE